MTEDERHALILAKVGEATATAQATQEIVGSRFKDVQRQLNLLTGLPAKVASLDTRVEGLERHRDELNDKDMPERLSLVEGRVSRVENDDAMKETRRWQWREIHRPSLLMSAVSVGIAVYGVLHG